MFRFNQDNAAGALFGLFGTVIIVLSQQYPLGTMRQMKAGYVPTVLGAMLIVIAVVLVIRGFSSTSEPMGRWALRPWLLVPSSILAFSLLVQTGGLVLAGVACMLLAAASGLEFRWREQIILATLVTGSAAMLFIKALGLPMTFFPAI